MVGASVYRRDKLSRGNHSTMVLDPAGMGKLDMETGSLLQSHGLTAPANNGGERPVGENPAGRGSLDVSLGPSLANGKVGHSRDWPGSEWHGFRVAELRWRSRERLGLCKIDSDVASAAFRGGLG